MMSFGTGQCWKLILFISRLKMKCVPLLSQVYLDRFSRGKVARNRRLSARLRLNIKVKTITIVDRRSGRKIQKKNNNIFFDPSRVLDDDRASRSFIANVRMGISVSDSGYLQEEREMLPDR